MAEDRSNKTEPATPKRKEEARRKGQIPKSADLTSWGAILVGLYLLPGAIGRVDRERDAARVVARERGPHVTRVVDEHRGCALVRGVGGVLVGPHG